jgi:hypothetical protein
MINSVEKQNYDDKNWVADKSVTPEPGTPVTVIFSPGWEK